jgi:hypothetical protein
MVIIPLLAICRVILAIASPPNSSVHLIFSIAEKQRAVKGESLAFDISRLSPNDQRISHRPQNRCGIPPSPTQAAASSDRCQPERMEVRE